METEHKTMSFDEAGAWLDEVADTFPPEFFNELNGGVVLRRAVVPSPHGHGLFIMGTYLNEPYGMGRYVAINYGSFVRLYGRSPPDEQKKALADVLRHELTHHIESLAGVRDLEVKDEIFLAPYKEGKGKGGFFSRLWRKKKNDGPPKTTK